ncbi:hypothetical protein ABDI30_00565 [Paenibacillus cisolokensis]|uniref:hypothetical protein n=1 Tax=Paenibacillus cisolokensis TaxID=1658519 RepID=UPI003D2B580C
MNGNRNIYVLLTDTGTMFTRLIKRVTAAPYNHASIALDEKLSEVYSFGRKCPGNPWIGGFVEENVYEGTFRNFPSTRCALLRLELSQLQYDEVNRVIRHYKEEEDDYRYNLIGLFGLLMRLDITRDKSYFCSQFVAETLRQSGVRLWDRSSTVVTPHDFMLHPALTVVYEGMLYDYPLLDQSRLADARLNMHSAV